MDANDIASFINDIVLAVVAVLTGAAAIQGISSWRTELKGRADFDAARGLQKRR